MTTDLVPERKGFYAIKIVQAEMYDLGNIDNIPHFILYDRETRTAIDVTSDVNPAPLLSKTAPAEVLSDEGSIETLEGLLSGELQPTPNWRDAGGVPCVTGFSYEELTDEKYASMRRTMVELRAAKIQLDEKVEELRVGCMTLRQKYLE